MKFFVLLVTTILFSQQAFPQSRINYNNQDLFLSGANLAWLNFANDIGPGLTDFTGFSDVMLQLHDHGGNALRLWLHTNGTITPEFDSAGYVSGPGTNTIEDLKAILDSAWKREIGLDLCLWSFDMLRVRTLDDFGGNQALLDAYNIIKANNKRMLTDTNYTRAYINNCLIPMVDSLKGHPAIIAWEIFNEPEGMSNQFGWSDIQHVDMSDIQRFINLCSGAIHRTDTAAQVTSGAWSFLALTDVPTVLAKAGQELSQFSSSQKEEIASQFKQKYRSSMSTNEVINYLEKISHITSYNYYTDDRLINTGGDPDGTLDFYSVHYYSGIVPSNPTSVSPFHHPKSYWLLDKPLVVAEFALQNSSGIPKEKLFDTLYQLEYAGALPWSWTDTDFSSHEDVLSSLQFMWDNYRNDVDVIGISGDWPNVIITSPENNTTFPDTSEIEITADAYDNDGYVVLVEFFANDTLLIGARDTLPFNYTWTNIPDGNYSIKAIATDNIGNQRTSNRVNIIVGTPAMTRLEEYRSARVGTDMAIVSDATASGGLYLDIRTNTPTNTITWTLPSVPQDGTYEIKFGYRCAYDSPKIQFINVNGTQAGEVIFEGAASQWLEKSTTVDLLAGQNTIQLQLSWGWMHLDYMAVPTEIVVGVDDLSGTPTEYSLHQNYPNPFNPETTIEFVIPKSSFVNLSIYDVLGRKVVTLINRELNAGNYSIPFKASTLASGVYFYRLETGNFSEIKKMMLLK